MFILRKPFNFLPASSQGKSGLSPPMVSAVSLSSPTVSAVNLSLPTVLPFAIVAMGGQSQPRNSKWKVPEIHFLFLLAFLFCVGASGSPGWPQIHHVADDALELQILLPPSPMCLDCRHVHHYGLKLNFSFTNSLFLLPRRSMCNLR